MGDVVVVEDDTEEVADIVEEVADAVVEVAEAVAEAVADAVEGNDDIEHATSVEHRLTILEQQMFTALSTGGVDYDTVRRMLDDYTNDLAAMAATVAAEVAEEVADEVADEASDDDGDGGDADITIVEPDVSEQPERRDGLFRRIW